MLDVEHSIQLVPDYRIHHQAPYRLSIPEATKLKRQLEELLRIGFIKPNNSPWGAPVLVSCKADETLCLCIDYRGLNRYTVKNSHPMPRFDELFDRLAGNRFFIKIDLRSIYHQIRVAAADQPNTLFGLRFGHYEFTVMSFDLTNAPVTFQRAMNDMFRDILEQYVLVYFDNIMVYSCTLEEHLRHLHDVLDRLRRHSFFAKLSNSHCSRPIRHKLNGVLDVTHRWDAGVRERRWENVVVLSDEVTNCGLQVYTAPWLRGAAGMRGTGGGRSTTLAGKVSVVAVKGGGVRAPQGGMTVQTASQTPTSAHNSRALLSGKDTARRNKALREVLLRDLGGRRANVTRAAECPGKGGEDELEALSHRKSEKQLTKDDLEKIDRYSYVSVGHFLAEYERASRKVWALSEHDKCFVFLVNFTNAEQRDLIRGTDGRLVWDKIQENLEREGFDQYLCHTLREARKRKKTLDSEKTELEKRSNDPVVDISDAKKDGSQKDAEIVRRNHRWSREKKNESGGERKEIQARVRVAATHTCERTLDALSEKGIEDQKILGRSLYNGAANCIRS
ncbi:hypothetical protein CBR_g68786 [Chara braunii]|uniref:Reverse transcriptase domain-containing protein n=1 Tax=Chara braunii TaxID=69332 RepID=A0A388K9T0_CHABU|nr:hypothetical protein CBR_g68786 [Chara braunii]|eukprot:GBG66800.1 hypothetical protein CBR_g68786 [Chara braunii]